MKFTSRVTLFMRRVTPIWNLDLSRLPDDEVHRKDADPGQPLRLRVLAVEPRIPGLLVPLVVHRVADVVEDFASQLIGVEAVSSVTLPGDPLEYPPLAEDRWVPPDALGQRRREQGCDDFEDVALELTQAVVLVEDRPFPHRRLRGLLKR
jgi:hypothetical protein